MNPKCCWLATTLEATHTSKIQQVRVLCKFAVRACLRSNKQNEESSSKCFCTRPPRLWCSQRAWDRSAEYCAWGLGFDEKQELPVYQSPSPCGTWDGKNQVCSSACGGYQPLGTCGYLCLVLEVLFGRSQPPFAAKHN